MSVLNPEAKVLPLLLSAFEAVITRQKLEKLKSQIPHYIDKVEDSVRLYQIRGKGQVISWGKEEEYSTDDIILI